eukprot:TRINITY_DN7679_c0_g1_i6.p2 TRINITY_DN7679_c0_g1~~TRINITY_DN7679_c0_g1_i6.p2  ORF type:complete len:355 (+),score=51.44 TRINITY_DN7679_c0_g1_i6:280-1344(+)
MNVLNYQLSYINKYHLKPFYVILSCVQIHQKQYNIKNDILSNYKIKIQQNSMVNIYKQQQYQSWVLNRCQEEIIMNFYKMQGAGNDFVFVEDFDFNIKNESDLAKKLCDRHYGIGADGLVIVRHSKVAEAKMIIINADGSRPNMCGNAIRCFGKYIFEKGIVKSKKFSVETGDGVKEIEIVLEGDKVKYIRVYMGKGSYDGKDIHLNNLDNLIDKNVTINGKAYKMTTVLVGVPHTIIFEDNREYSVEEEGSIIEKYEYFKEGTNVNFVKIIDDTHIRVNTWERGAGATLACGTGCSASVFVAKKLKFVDKDKEIFVKAPGGELVIEVLNEDIFMKGPAEFVFSGEVYQGKGIQ